MPISHTLGLSSTSTVAATSSVSGTEFDHVLTIIMENKPLQQITCSGCAPYMSGLISQYSFPSQYYGVTHPSLPNYLSLTGGSTFGCSGYDGPPNSNACTQSAWNSKNIVDRLEGRGLTWKAYMESMPSNCYGSNSGKYAVRHDPFVYYKDIVSNPGRCSRIVPAGSGDSTLLNDLKNPSTAPNYMWLSPDLCNDMHDCSVSTGNTFLAGLVPKILTSQLFKTARALLVVTFDEGSSSQQNIYTVFLGPAAKTGYTSSAHYSHFSLLRTVEDNWKLAPLASNDGSARNMFEFFANVTIPNPPPPPPTSPVIVSLSWSPSAPVAGETVTFIATASGGSSGYTYGWDYGDSNRTGSAMMMDHVYLQAGSYKVTVTVTDSSKTSAAVSDTVTVVPSVPVPPVQATIVSFSWAPMQPLVGRSVSFTAASQGGNGRAVSFVWSFGDGVSDSGSTVSHAYSQAGSYNVTVDVRDDQGTILASSAQDIPVVVATSPPVLSSPVNQTVTIGSTLNLKISARSPNGDSNLTYALVLAPSGATIDQSSGVFSWTPTEEYANGDYKVIVRVSDSTGTSSTVTMLVAVLPGASTYKVTGELIFLLAVAILSYPVLVVLGVIPTLRRRILSGLGKWLERPVGSSQGSVGRSDGGSRTLRG